MKYEELWVPSSLEEAQWYCDSINQGDRFWEHGRELARDVIEIAKRVYDDLSDKTAIDFGCGVGRTVIPLAEEFGRVIGVDVSKEMIDLAPKDKGNVEFTLTSNPAPFRPNTVHTICSFYTFQHMDVPDVKSAMRRMYTALKPGGVCVLDFSGNGAPFSGDATVEVTTPPIRKTIAYTPDIVANLATEVGFPKSRIEVVTFRRDGDDYTYHRLIARKSLRKRREKKSEDDSKRGANAQGSADSNQQRN